MRAELAQGAEETQRGLMFRKNLDQDKAMLFIYSETSRHAFWMKNMRFPLDIIWIGADRRINHIYKNAPPCKDICNDLIPPSPAQFVLEVNAGFTEKHQIQIGDRVKF